MNSKFNESYQRYFEIIEKARLLNRSKNNGEYFENHHIIPNALGGYNTKKNLVLLTPEEHYICHSLLPDFCEGESKAKMIFAWNLLNNTREINGLEIIGSIKYGELKRKFAKNMSEKATKIAAEINNDPIRYERKIKKFKQSRKNLMADPIKRELNRALHAKRAKESWNKIKQEDPERAKEIIKKRSISLKKTVAEKKKDPVKMEAERQKRSAAAKKYQAELNADPVRYERRRLNRIGVTDKAIVHLNENWKYINRYPSIKIAAKKLDYPSPSCISHSLRGRTRACRGQHWVYEKDFKKDPEKTIERAKKVSDTFTKEIIQMDMDNNIINIFKNVTSIRNKFNIDPPIVIKILLGELDSYQNKKWKFKT